jgi:hypothetical protein
MDMDGNRIDQLLVTHVPQPAPETETEDGVRDDAS